MLLVDEKYPCELNSCNDISISFKFFNFNLCIQTGLGVYLIDHYDLAKPPEEDPEYIKKMEDDKRERAEKKERDRKVSFSHVFYCLQSTPSYLSKMYHVFLEIVLKSAQTFKIDFEFQLIRASFENLGEIHYCWGGFFIKL